MKGKIWEKENQDTILINHKIKLANGVAIMKDIMTDIGANLGMILQNAMVIRIIAVK